jgi:hypothetical protein
MSYSDFTLSELKTKFKLSVQENLVLFPTPPTLSPSSRLTELLAQYIPLATSINTEKARSELIIAPILAELRWRFQDQISLFSGIEFNVDQSLGLNGRCDYIIAQSPEQLELVSPVVVMVEAKNENLIAGIPQCIAEMIAAQRYNEKNQHPLETLYGCVTTGSLWRFLKLRSQTAYVDTIEYPVQTLDQIMGILAAAARQQL